jgi:hypothetical protein
LPLFLPRPQLEFELLATSLESTEDLRGAVHILQRSDSTSEASQLASSNFRPRLSHHLTQPTWTRLEAHKKQSQTPGLNRPSLTMSTVPPCRFFQQGRCQFGADCRNSHGSIPTKGNPGTTAATFRCSIPSSLPLLPALKLIFSISRQSRWDQARLDY